MNIEELAPGEGGEGDELLIEDDQNSNAPKDDNTDDAQGPTIEGLAEKMGWTPEETWRGDPEKWKPADQFLESTVDINTGLSTKLKGMESKLDQVVRTSARITEQQVAKAREDVQAERQEAFDAGDTEAFNKAEEKLQTLNVPDPSVTPPETVAFIERNSSWWNSDADAQQYAVGLAGEVSKLPAAKQIEYVERKMKDVYPEYFPDKVKPKAPALNKPGARQAVKKTAGIASLPKEAQAMYRDYAKKGMTEKDFLEAWKEEAADE